jgi:GrpB-like predicted nucleotidyltransferase (UPF0157 family)
VFGRHPWRPKAKQYFLGARLVVVEEYTPLWETKFLIIKKIIAASLTRAKAIEHIGSTSIPGMCAKPIIDIDIEIEGYSFFNITKSELEIIGYVYVGNQGVPNREVFKRNGKLSNSELDKIKHHLYVCPSKSEEMRRHILFRNFLRRNDDLRDEYRKIKMHILDEYGKDNRKKYVEAKEKEYKWFFEKVERIAEQS